MSPVSTGKRKKRAGVACDFCRHRKLGCDNEKPRCENCRFQGKDCTYSERTKKIRPTNIQMHQLEEQNQQLKISLAKLQSQLNTGTQQMRSIRNDNRNNVGVVVGDGIDSAGTADGQLQLPATPVSVSGTVVVTPKTTVSASSSHSKQPYLSTGDREVHFHGPSSAMFDGSHLESTNTSNFGAGVDRSKSFELLGACIKQRQMEPIDFAAGRLDFDGVDPELGMHLLSVFWNRQHALGSVVYRPTFMRDMACNGPYFSKILLNAIYFAAAKNSTRAEFRCARIAVQNDNDNVELPAIVSPFRRRAEELLFQSTTPGLPVPLAMTSEITTIQALLVISDALFTWCDERSLSWHYSGLAINMILDLGIHSGKQTPALKSKLSSEDLEVRRRLFWAAFVQDKIQSTYQGRPARLRRADIGVPISFLDDYEELEQFNALSYSANSGPTGFSTHSVSVFEQLCKLSIIMDKILCNIYAENCGQSNSTNLLSTARALHNELVDWRNALPEHLNINFNDAKKPSLTPHALSLMSMYHCYVILLHRPFVSDGHITGTSSSVIREAFTACATAASAIDGILRVFCQHFCITTVPYFMSYATYVSGTIHVRIAAQSAQGSEAHRSLQNSLDVLSQQQGVCRAPRRARQILLSLARRLNVDLSTPVDTLSAAVAMDPSDIASEEPSDFIRTRGSQALVDDTDGSVTHALDNTTFNSQSEFDLIMSGLDIDAIIQSFDFENNGFMNAEHIANTEPPYERATRTASEANTNENTFQEWSFQDPVFGYDSLFADNTLAF